MLSLAAWLVGCGSTVNVLYTGGGEATLVLTDDDDPTAVHTYAVPGSTLDFVGADSGTTTGRGESTVFLADDRVGEVVKLFVEVVDPGDLAPCDTVLEALSAEVDWEEGFPVAVSVDAIDRDGPLLFEGDDGTASAAGPSGSASAHVTAAWCDRPRPGYTVELDWALDPELQERDRHHEDGPAPFAQ